MHIDISIDDRRWTAIEHLESLVTEAVSVAAQVAAGDTSGAAELSVVLTGDAAIRVLNRDYRGIDRPTNVLSFPAQPAPNAVRMFGDIVLAWETVVAEATVHGKRRRDHMRHLIVHGMLHLIGYDHATGPEADRMEALEVQILGILGIPDPYILPRAADLVGSGADR